MLRGVLGHNSSPSAACASGRWPPSAAAFSCAGFRAVARSLRMPVWSAPEVWRVGGFLRQKSCFLPATCLKSPGELVGFISASAWTFLLSWEGRPQPRPWPVLHCSSCCSWGAPIGVCCRRVKDARYKGGVVGTARLVGRAPRGGQAMVGHNTNHSRVCVDVGANPSLFPVLASDPVLASKVPWGSPTRAGGSPPPSRGTDGGAPQTPRKDWAVVPHAPCKHQQD